MRIETERDIYQRVIIELEIQGDLFTDDAISLLEENVEVFNNGFFAGDTPENIAGKILQGY